MDRTDGLLERVEALERHTAALERLAHTVAQRLRWWRGLACGLVALALLSWALPPGTAQEDITAGRPGRLEERLAALEHKLRHLISATNEEGLPEVRITGANLRIVNGLGRTDCTDEQGNPMPDCPNGLGNLIVGYNEPRTEGFENMRTGSHNIVVGKEHNFSRFGGLVVGLHNEISGDFSAISGGGGNIASGTISSISGGGGASVASGLGASISGGSTNTASGAFSSVSGGLLNNATNAQSWVGGGTANTASGLRSSVSGGLDNTAEGDHSSISGGEGNEASGEVSSISGGEHNLASGIGSSVSGGRDNGPPANTPQSAVGETWSKRLRTAGRRGRSAVRLRAACAHRRLRSSRGAARVFTAGAASVRSQRLTAHGMSASITGLGPLIPEINDP
jgi:hypothetical protein